MANVPETGTEWAQADTQVRLQAATRFPRTIFRSTGERPHSVTPSRRLSRPDSGSANVRSRGSSGSAGWRKRKVTSSESRNRKSHDRFVTHRGAMEISNATFNLWLERFSKTSNDSDLNKSPNARRRASMIGNSAKRRKLESARTKKVISPNSLLKYSINETLAISMSASTSRVLHFRKDGCFNRRRPSDSSISAKPIKLGPHRFASVPSLSVEKFSTTFTGPVLPISPEYCTIGRYINELPTMVLDAHRMKHDKYLNLVDWGPNNILASAIGLRVYFWWPETQDITQFCSLSDSPTRGANHITSIKFGGDQGQLLAIGDSTHRTTVWDVSTSVRLHTIFHAKFGSHAERVGVLAWNGTKSKSTLAMGSSDGSIILRDIRLPAVSFDSDIGQARVLSGHMHEVCGLAWSNDELTLASGGMDNRLSLWDVRSSSSSSLFSPQSFGNKIRARTTMLDHTGPIKALAWCPNRHNVLASGGMENDHTIKIWNTVSGLLLSSVETSIPVPALLWSPDGSEIVSTGGSGKLGDMCIWHYPYMLKLKQVGCSHIKAPIGLCAAPDRLHVASWAPEDEETLCIWKLFNESTKRGRSEQASATLQFSKVR